MVAIGGVGGSGTRVFAELLQKCGYFIGNDLNEPLDNLLFTLLFKMESILISTDEEFKELYEMFMKVMKQDSKLSSYEKDKLSKLASVDRTLHDKTWLLERLENLEHQNIDKKLLGFKEPNTHIVIERLLGLNKELKFIYIYRNGLDMAYSQNQNQLKLWGGIFFNEQNIELSPKNSLKYWCEVHKRMLKLQRSYPKRVIMLDFDQLFQSPKDILKQFSEFIGYNQDITNFMNIIKKPSSIGRHKQFSLDVFHKEDLKFVQNLYKT